MVYFCIFVLSHQRQGLQGLKIDLHNFKWLVAHAIEQRNLLIYLLYGPLKSFMGKAGLDGLGPD